MLTVRLHETALLLAAGGADPPLQFKVDTLIFSLIIFVGLAAVLFKFAWRI